MKTLRIIFCTLLFIAIAHNQLHAGTVFTIDGLVFETTSTSTVALRYHESYTSTPSNPTTTWIRSGYTKNSYSGDIVIPEYVFYNDVKYNVTQIFGLTFCNYSWSSTSDTYTGGNITSVDIPATIESIGSSAFRKNQKLTQITCRVIDPISISSTVFQDVDKSKCVLYVPYQSIQLYKAADVWKDFMIEAIPGTEELEETDYDIYSDEIIIGTAHQPIEIPIKIKNDKAITGFEATLACNNSLVAFNATASTESDGNETKSINPAEFMTITSKGTGLDFDGSFFTEEEGITATVTAHISNNGESEPMPIEIGDTTIVSIRIIPLKQGVYDFTLNGLKIYGNNGLEIELSSNKALTIAARQIEGDLNDDGTIDEKDDPNYKAVSLIDFSFYQQSKLVNTHDIVNVPIRLDNRAEVYAMEFDITVPEGVSVEDADFLTATERTESAEVTATREGAVIHVAIASENGIEAGKGNILNLALKAETAGEYALNFSNITVTASGEKVFELDDTELQFVPNHKRGDYNEDGKVNIVDVQNLMEIVLGN